MRKELGVVVLATNAYFILGLRLVRRFMHHYKGGMTLKFYFFSDTDPAPYLPDGTNIEYHYDSHSCWTDGTNSKFKNIVSLEGCSSDYLYYFDADTNVVRDFTEGWFLGDLVGGEHFNSKYILDRNAGFDRNPKGNSYVPQSSTKPYTYHYGAFFGGRTEEVIKMCKGLREWQSGDQRIGYEPPVNDESYINKYFHYSPPYTVPMGKFQFIVSDKGSLGNTRVMTMCVENQKKDILAGRDKLWDIVRATVVFKDA